MYWAQYDQLVNCVLQKIEELHRDEIACGKARGITGASGHRHPIDVCVNTPSIMLIVECKCWRESVDAGAVLTFAARYLDIKKGRQPKEVKAALVTTVGCGGGARQLADYFELELWEVKNEQEFVVRILAAINAAISDSNAGPDSDVELIEPQ